MTGGVQDDRGTGRHLLARCRVAAVWEEALGSLLADRGCLGVQPVDGVLQAESGDVPSSGEGAPADEQVEVELVFAASASPEASQDLEIELRRTLAEFADAGVDVTLLGVRHDPGTDWLAVYRASAQPIRVGSVLIDPRESPEAGVGSGRDEVGGDLLRLHLPAEQAFGTGSHETTQSMLLLLQGRRMAGLSMLDVGCGSGVLCFVALALGARRTIGIEIDPASTFVARRNESRNRSRDWAAADWVTGTVDCLAALPDRYGAPAGGFDRVLVNVLPHRIRGQERAISAQVAVAGGELWVGGLLVDQVAELTELWQAFGLRRVGVEEHGEWATLVFHREAPQGAPS